VGVDGINMRMTIDVPESLVKEALANLIQREKVKYIKGNHGKINLDIDLGRFRIR
jgi:hypothetical protein